MTIKLTLKEMKQLKADACYIVSENEVLKMNINKLGNNYYYANYLGCRIRVQECFAINEFGSIYNVLVVNQDYEGVFRK